MLRLARSCALVLGLVTSVTASAQTECRTIEVNFKPTSNLQIAVWVEDEGGKYIDTMFVTRATGVFGLANRPGHHLMKSDFRWPYGRRDMVLPVWAHRRNKQYRRVQMGGAPGYDEASCAQGGVPASECDDDTVAYHFYVSSPEPYYCSPSGGSVRKGPGGVDVVSCASSFYGSKGAYAAAPAFSLYPPRADLTSWDPHDGVDSRMNFAKDNDLVPISGATPRGNEVIATPIRWTPPADGNYVVWVEASLEGDSNAFHNHDPFPEPHTEWSAYGKVRPFGQPSVLYRIPVVVGADTHVQVSNQYEGYSDWDGATGTLHLADMTISDSPGTGAGRFLAHSDDDGSYRVKVVASPTCGAPTPGTCTPPDAPQAMTVETSSTTVDVSFASSTSGPAVTRFDLRYREGMAITDDDFTSAVPSSTSPPAPGQAGETVTTMITGLRPDRDYTIAVRALSECSSASKIATVQVHTKAAQYTVLHGCFIATAAFGSSLAHELDALRHLRDRVLLKSPVGQVAVAAYYTLSPPLARVLSDNAILRAGARHLLGPLVALSNAVTTKP